MRRLNASVGVKMFGLRRIGKSTFRQIAIEHFEEVGRPYAYVDGQGVNSLVEFLGRLSRALPQDSNLLTRALNLINGGPAHALLEGLIEGGPVEEQAAAAYWRVVAGAVRQALKDGEKPVLIIDEFSYIIENFIERDPENGRDNADTLLAAMREWRDAGMTMLLTGSLGFKLIARKHNLNNEHLNDLQPFPLPELTEAEARDMIARCTKEKSKGAWTDNHTDEFIRQCGVLYPSFIVSGLLAIGVEAPPSAEAFAEIFEEQIRPEFHADFYEQFNRRFKAYKDLPNNEREGLLLPAMAHILQGAAVARQELIPVGEGFSSLDLSEALDLLAEDGFLTFTENIDGERSWKPASRLVKLWWRRSKLA